jgi:hypothetical protein
MWFFRGSDGEWQDLGVRTPASLAKSGIAVARWCQCLETPQDFLSSHCVVYTVARTDPPSGQEWQSGPNNTVVTVFGGGLDQATRVRIKINPW